MATPISELERMAESTSAHGIRFWGLGALKREPTEEELLEIELGRLAARQVNQNEISRSERSLAVIQHLMNELRDYRGVSLPSFLAGYSVTIKPKY